MTTMMMFAYNPYWWNMFEKWNTNLNIMNEFYMNVYIFVFSSHSSAQMIVCARDSGEKRLQFLVKPEKHMHVFSPGT